MRSLGDKRPRQARSIRNDERILNAATELLSDNGWGGFALATVAPRADLSKRPIIDRFPDRQALAIGVWRDRVVPELLPALEALLDPATRTSADDLEQALQPFYAPSPAMLAGSELLVVRGYEPRIRRVVDASLRPVIERWTTPEPGKLTRADAARNAFVLMIGLGLLQTAPGGTSAAPSISREIKVVSEALASPAKPLRQPSDSASYLEEGFVFDTEDPVLRGVLQVVLEEVGERGFDGATMTRITRAAGVSEGYIFGRYKTKMDLFIDATDQSFGHSVMLNHQFTDRLNKRGPKGMGEAVSVREWMAPGRELLRAIQIEQQRLTRHTPALQAASALRFEEFLESVGGIDSPLEVESIYAGRFYFSVAWGVGLNTLAQLSPQTWDLPYDVVTIPLESLL